MEPEAISSPIKILLVPKKTALSSQKPKRSFINLCKSKASVGELSSSRQFIHTRRVAPTKDSELLTIKQLPSSIAHSSIHSPLKPSTKQNSTTHIHSHRYRHRHSHNSDIAILLKAGILQTSKSCRGLAVGAGRLRSCRKSEGVLSRVKTVRNSLLLLRLRKRTTVVSGGEVEASVCMKNLITIRKCKQFLNRKHSAFTSSSRQIPVISKPASRHAQNKDYKRIEERDSRTSVTPLLSRQSSVRSAIKEAKATNRGRPPHVVATIRIPSSKYKGEMRDAWTSTAGGISDCLAINLDEAY